MIKSTLLTQVNDLERFKNFGEFSSSDISVDVENLTLCGLGEGSENRESSSTNRSLDRFFVDRSDATDVSVTRLIEVFGSEDSSGDGTSASAESFEGGNEFEILREEDSSSVGEGSGVGDTNTCRESLLAFPSGNLYIKGERLTIDVIGNDSISFKSRVEFVTHSMNYDGIETNSVKEVETEGEGFEFVSEDSSSDFEDGEMSCGGEDLKVSRYFTTGSERIEQPNDSLLCRFGKGYHQYKVETE